MKNVSTPKEVCSSIIRFSYIHHDAFVFQIKARTKRLTELFESYFPYKDRIGRRYRALVTEISRDKQFYVGHNESYEQILLPMDANIMGQMVDVEIVSCARHYMVGRVPDKSSLRKLLPLAEKVTYVVAGACVIYLMLKLRRKIFGS